MDGFLALLILMGIKNCNANGGIPAETKAAMKLVNFIKAAGVIAILYGIFILVWLAIEAGISLAHAQTTQHTFRDANGRSMGRSVTDTRGNTNFYNDRGQTTGRSSTDSRGNTTIYNERGQQTGRISK
jgi:hypothetical protein